jgi:hypothetical protein
MSVKDEVIRIVQSRGRVARDGDQDMEPDVVNLMAAVRELQQAVVYLGEAIDERDKPRDEGRPPQAPFSMVMPGRPAPASRSNGSATTSGTRRRT